MAHRKLAAALAVVTLIVAALVYSAVQANAKNVVTVDQLVKDAQPRSRVRLGARVTEDEIRYVTTPAFELSFTVRDIAHPDERLPVLYRGLRPDTFQSGRDVILEGEFDGKSFAASSLLTQCPSKYEPPLPGGN